MTYPEYPTSPATARKYAAHLTGLRGVEFVPIRRKSPRGGQALNFATVARTEVTLYQGYGWEVVPAPQPRRRA